MRHRVGTAKLKRDVGARNSLLKNLVTSVVLNDFVITTVPKAKAVKPLVDNMVTLAKRDTLHTRRQAAAFLKTPASVKKLFDTIGPKFSQRHGGYTRITRLAFRKGDGAELCKLELVGTELVKRAAERAKRKEERLKSQREGKEENPDE
jgi:large subunit ribosomal protein L17